MGLDRLNSSFSTEKVCTIGLLFGKLHQSSFCFFLTGVQLIYSVNSRFTAE